MTIVSFSLAILAFGLIQSFLDVWYLELETSSARRLVTRNGLSLAYLLPISYKDKIRVIEGVKTVSYCKWYVGMYINQRNIVIGFAIDPMSYLELYQEIIIDPVQKADFIHDRRSCVAGSEIVKKFGWKIGDIITLKELDLSDNRTFILRGIFHQEDQDASENYLLIHWDYVNGFQKKNVSDQADMVNYYIVGVANLDKIVEVAVSIDKAFKNSFPETLTETERAFQLSLTYMIETILKIIKLLSVVIIIIIMIVVTNTMVMSVRERIREYAILKAIGYGGLVIFILVLCETLVITIIGCILGFLMTYPAAKVVSSFIRPHFPSFYVELELIYLDLLVSVMVAFVAAIFARWRIINISIAEGLGNIRK